MYKYREINEKSKLGDKIIVYTNFLIERTFFGLLTILDFSQFYS